MPSVGFVGAVLFAGLLLIIDRGSLLSVAGWLLLVLGYPVARRIDPLRLLRRHSRREGAYLHAGRAQDAAARCQA